ncbi:hypothetical protein V1477_014053 [Vespula maculifrons]|uniref:Uncharacterized protein n=1 Tax=Vespula maculifrons TaxID=7453 RepID=A0ABD2BM10_VESMC
MLVQKRRGMIGNEENSDQLSICAVHYSTKVKPPQPFDTASPRYGKYPGSESRYSAYKLTSAVTYMGEQHYGPRKSQILWQILAKIRSLKRRVPLVDRFVR